ncbi:hypothetical protein F0562_011462 [Nyssa sinensis]|uniref:Uncharacterized protein n=1 Tax=Nyssa sinensis TaxID=561372 RepID=A0A5J5A4G8_9ASTE|nr:hypothetical protein F0562_011462 [Nyssa sinensis]
MGSCLGKIEIQGGNIISVVEEGDWQGNIRSGKVIDYGEAVVMPGLIDGKCVYVFTNVAQLVANALDAIFSKGSVSLVQIVGHSLGGGTAALLTYVLREQKELSTATRVTFAAAACMTWELAKSGNGFITSVINGKA